MKDFLIGAGIGFVMGAILTKSNKELSSAVEKGKKVVDEKVEQGKEFVEENIIKPAQKASNSKKQ